MRKDNVDLICDIAELAGLFEKSSSLQDFLQTASGIIAWHMKAAVCSIYLYDETREELTLFATQGLKSDAVGQVRLKLGEGITGLALKELRPICEGRGSTNPAFKFIPGTDEERYEAFLAVPIVRGLTRVGVIVTQDPKPDYFDENDVKALRAIAGQLASTIENAKLFLSLHQARELRPEPQTEPDELRFLTGRPASEGIAVGQGSIIGMIDEEVMRRFDEDPTPRTMDDFTHAMADTEKQLTALQKELEEKLSDVASMIFSAHLLILKDAEFTGAIARLIEAGTPPQRAILAIVRKYIDLFSGSSSRMLQEKVLDVKDLGHRLLLNLMSHDPDHADYSNRIIVAREILPSGLLKLAAQRAAGVILVGTGIASHVAIIARSLQIPAVLVDDPRLLSAADNRTLLMDAIQGNVFLDPGPEILSRYQALIAERALAESREPDVTPETETRDGTRVKLMANINLISDVKAACRLKAEGIGLYRSEFPFIVRHDFPSEEEQYRIYRRLIEEMSGRPATLRTLDIGGDKMLSYLPDYQEANPFLGLRAIRFSLRNIDIFSQQLRAMLRAGHDAHLRIMFPLISSADDFLHARSIVEDCIRQLASEGLPHNPSPELGIMIELPSAIELIDELAVEADFLSIGSNDLIQYLLAVDRTNELISDLYLPYHPAVLRALRRVADAAIRSGIDVSICGDLAMDERMLPFLLGIGIWTLSIDARALPRIQQAIRTIDIGEAAETARQMTRFGRIRDIEHYLGMSAAEG